MSLTPADKNILKKSLPELETMYEERLTGGMEITAKDLLQEITRRTQVEQTNANLQLAEANLQLAQRLYLFAKVSAVAALLSTIIAFLTFINSASQTPRP